jgi:hypothetical protein
VTEDAPKPVLVVIDGPDLYRQERDSGTRFSYHGVRPWVGECGMVAREVRYYASPVNRNGFIRVRPLLDFLLAQEVVVVESTNALYSHLLLDCASAADDVGAVLVVSSSPALAPLGAFMRRRGKKMYVACVDRYLSTDLRSASDYVFPLESSGLLEKFSRPAHGDRQ